MASLTWCTWVWVNSGSWWWTGRPGVLRFTGSQRVRHDWVAELNWYTLVGIGVGFACKVFLFMESMSLKHLQIYVLDCNSTNNDWGLCSKWDAKSWIRIFDGIWIYEPQEYRSSPRRGCLYPILSPALWGSPSPHFTHSGVGRFPISELPTIQEGDVGGRKPHLPFGFVPRPNKARKVFLFWEKQFILDSCFLPHLGRWDNLNAVLSALTLEFLAAKLKKKKKKKKLKEA